MLTFLNPYMTAIKIGLALVLLAALTAGVLAYNEHERDIGRNEVQSAWDRANAMAIAARARRIAAARAGETELQAAANEDRRRTNAERDRLDARVAVLTRQLRDRPERPTATGGADVPAGAAGPGPASACTGAGLYRDDGVFLIGEARMCQDIREQRDTYLRQYQRAQQTLKALGKEP